MRIVFPELDNPIIKSAVAACPEIEAVPSTSPATGCEALMRGEADAMITGIDYTTRDVILACKDTIPMVDEYFTSCFVMTKGDQTLILADGGVCKRPDDKTLFAIVDQTYKTAQKLLTEKPHVAMLSFSTFGSGGEDESIECIQKVLERIRVVYPEMLIDGEMQLDVAIDEVVAQKKAPKSVVAGHANVLICPDLNSGNILYKAMERFGGWTAAGPILQGFTKPVSDLSRGSTVEDVISVIKVMEKLA